MGLDLFLKYYNYFDKNVAFEILFITSGKSSVQKI